jgi:hypothetical protein
MINRPAVTATALATVALGGTLTAAAPAAAGGIGDFLSPAFGVSCTNLNNGARADGATTHGTGAADGNLAGLPVGSALNQCGGADMPQVIQLGGGPAKGATDMLGHGLTMGTGIGGAGGKYGDNAVGALIPGGESMIKPMLGPLLMGRPQPVGAA